MEGKQTLPRSKLQNNMPSPTNKTALQGFLDLVSYYQLYIPKMYKIRAPLNNLGKKDTKWDRTKERKQIFEVNAKVIMNSFSPKSENN